jgi:hypothetical protein
VTASVIGTAGCGEIAELVTGFRGRACLASFSSFVN